MKYAIVTGTSKGLGEAIAFELLERNVHLFCISRHENRNLTAQAKEKNSPLEYFTSDLSESDDIENLVGKIVERIDTRAATDILLVNNAGVVSPVGPTERNASRDIINSLSVNIIAPVILTSRFIRQTEGFGCKRTVINITSGAGKKPYYGWSTYCSSKAAIDMYTKVVALEQAERKNPVNIFSFAPGVVDTDMQTLIRNTSVEDFPSIDRFKALKEEGRLLEPRKVARKMIDLLESGTFESGGIYDIRNF
ncbi:MAG: (S)-benzoin forming benzil reductase [Chitinispirillaceae bacterium]